jgi:drug/metabolite transporter (DMT)-like permease
MLTVLLATATSALFGVADFLGGLASRRESAFAITAVAHGVGVVIFAIALVVFPAQISYAATLPGIVAGVSGGIGVVSLYAALARGRMSIVAPLTAALSGSLPALYDVARGSELSANAIAGLLLAFVATVVVSATAGVDADGVPALPLIALALAILAGFGFAGSFIGFSLAAPDGRFWPLATARVTSFVLLASVTLTRRRTLAIDPTVRRAAIITGLLDASANVTMISAIRIGPLAVASVLGSLYPVMTVLLARVVLGERLRPLQQVGVAMAFAAVLLAAWP